MLGSSRPYTFDRVVRLVISLAIAGIALWLLNVLSGALLPFFIACLLAYIFKPFVAFNKRVLRCKGNIIPIFLFLIELIGVIVAAGYLLIPRMAEEISAMARLLGDYASSTAGTAVSADVHRFIREHIDFNYLASLLTKEQWYELIKSSISGTWTMLSGGISLIIALCGWFIVLLYFIFILLDYERFMRGMVGLIPQKYKGIVLKIATDIKESMNRYFRGQALVAFIVGILFCIGFLIIDMPMAIVLGLFIGVLNLVPYLQLISLLPTTLLCFVYSAETGIGFWPMFAMAMAVYIVVQVIQDLYLVPKIMGKTMGLNPAIILLSLSVWGTLLGFLGLIVALPLTTLLLSYYNTYVLQRGEPEEATPEAGHEDEANGEQTGEANC